MNKKILFLTVVGIISSINFNLFGSVKHDQYIAKGTPNLANNYANWTPGSLYPETSVQEDENFFISRVKPMKRFTFAATQVIQDDKTNMRSQRKVLWWCPIGESNWTSLPRYAFDSEAFSSWSYIDCHGAWTDDFIRLPGAFSDITHKNGVVNSVVSQPAWQANLSTDGNGAIYAQLYKGGATKLLKLLRYYGIDGIGFNSECSFAVTVNGVTLYSSLQSLFAQMHSQKNTLGWDQLQINWYDGVTNSGSQSFTYAVTSNNYKWFASGANGNPVCNGFFLNYGTGASNFSSSISYINSNLSNSGVTSYDVYCGMDMQGRSVAAWPDINNYAVSIGIWGAHNKCMPYESSTDNGSTANAIQYRYLEKCEQLFTGGTKNPVNDLPITSQLTNGTSTTFHGFAKLVAAKSSLSWAKNGYFPFVSYFNLGNGKFFNKEGNTTYDNEWYNIGMQDFLPTWRWWITTTFMGRTTDKVPSGFNAGFCYEDAWFGGSCLKISSTTATPTAYVQLFKTQMLVDANSKLTIRYKVLKGTASLAWACSIESAPNTELNKNIGNLTASDNWVEKTINIRDVNTAWRALYNQTLAVIGLKFTNVSSDFEILIGEISLKKEGTTYSPTAPTITKSKILKTTYNGVDFKVIFDCGRAGKTDSSLPVYNSEVDTWFFEIYLQQKGGEEQLVTATTSWAAYAVEVPIDLGKEKSVRLGVRPVAPDGTYNSEIVWSNYLDCSSITVLEGFSVDKPVIKANENFTVSFDDPNHSNATKFEIYKSSNNALVTGKTFSNCKEFTTSLTELGLYDVAVTYQKNGNSVTEIKRGMIQVSGPEVGALPRIKTLTASDVPELERGQTVTFDLNYTGTSSEGTISPDGTTSRGLFLNEMPFCVPISAIYAADNSLNFNTTDLTISCWFSPIEFIDAGDASGNTGFGDCGTQMLNIRNPGSSWPSSDWGYIWSGIHNGGNDYWLNIQKQYQTAGSNYTTMTKDFVIPTGKWTHLAVSINATTKTVKLFINGREVSDQVQGKSNVATVSANDVIYMGGPAFSRSGFFGYIDEFQIWKKSFDAATISQTMKHIENVPNELIGYWDFEQDQDADLQLSSTGSLSGLKACIGKTWKNAQGIGSSSATGSNPNVEGNRVPASWGAGTPFLSGIYQVVTTPSWKFTGAPAVSNTTGNYQAGTASATYGTPGTYKGTLTLKNSWGSDSRDIELIVIDACTGLDNQTVVENLSVYPNPFAETLYVQFIKAGNYELSILNMNGQVIKKQNINVADKEITNISLQGQTGMYLLQIKTEGKIIQTVKMEKK